MPIYEYRCSNCGKHFEIFQKITDAPLTECKVCSGTLTKLISSCSFQLKGTGWYMTDYKRPIDSVGKSSPSNGNGDHAPKETAPQKAGETKTSETKTEGKTESTPTTSA
ncbi:MAG: zinc ribbon domain-containing protein [Syntrophorhabdaceae bacterium]|nr:zinc ribbon domain-containing protein [Syntrophorhabdaceae bacterium]